jgi:hypothetical protein
MITKTEIKEIYLKHLEAMNGDTGHVYRVWKGIINLKSYDLVSPKALNTKLKDILKSYGIKKSVEFSEPLKALFLVGVLYFDNEFKLVEGGLL